MNSIALTSKARNVNWLSDNLGAEANKSLKFKDPTKKNELKTAKASPTSPTLLTMKAFIAAVLALSFL